MRKLGRLMSSFWTCQFYWTIIFLVVTLNFYRKPLLAATHPDQNHHYGSTYPLALSLVSFTSALLILSQLWRLYFSAHQLFSFIAIETGRITLWAMMAWEVKETSERQIMRFNDERRELDALEHTVMCRKTSPMNVGLCGLEPGRSILPGSWNATSETLERWAIRGALIVRYEEGFWRRPNRQLVAPYPSPVAVKFAWLQFLPFLIIVIPCLLCIFSGTFLKHGSPISKPPKIRKQRRILNPFPFLGDGVSQLELNTNTEPSFW